MKIDSLSGQHVAILGGSSGIGLGTAEFLLESGAVVTITGRRPALLDDAREQLAARTGAGADRLRVVASDARDADQVDAALTAAADDEGQLAAIFVPAGGTEDFRLVLDHTVESVVADYVGNVAPLVNAITRGAPRMMRDGGSIVAVSSVASILSSTGISSYGAANAALDQYVRFAADELGAHRIRVNAVRPGLTTNRRDSHHLEDAAFLAHFRAITPLGDYGFPEDFAPMVGLLLSAETRWITGQVFSIDGGFSLRGHGGGATTVSSVLSDLQEAGGSAG